MDLAKWLAENHIEVAEYINRYPLNEAEKLEALTKLIVNQHKLSYEDASIMLEDENLRIVVDRYYLKELH